MIFRQSFEPVSGIGQERACTPRLGGGRILEGFERIMPTPDPPCPRFIDYALPGSRLRGVCPPGIPEEPAEDCPHIPESHQG